ncbi:MAG: hypothetical protein JWM80_4812 [Cyanobacteria bacterium RYN_339]|nr:hypothetical protein [Cyanobacteria bacterium RYN_339]
MKSWPIRPLSLVLALAMSTACGRIPSFNVGSKAQTGAIAAHQRLAAETTGLVISFAKPTLHPLPDKAKDAEAGAECTAMTVQANRDGVPVPGLRVRLQAGFNEHSGGHLHDESHRPVGAFYNAKSLGPDTTVTTDQEGKVRLTYRASGIGGIDVVSASTGDGLAGRAELPVAYELGLMPEPGPADHYVLVGQTADHPVNHYCTPGTQALMVSLADEFFKLFAANFLINDQSIASGGPFDLGPAYGVPYWTLGSKHENHRQGISTDIRSGNQKWRQAITRLGGSVFVEDSHWHITTVAEPSITTPRIPAALEASGLSVSISAHTSFQRATNTIAYEYQITSAPASRQKLAVFAIAVGSKVLSASAPKGWSGGAYRNRPLWSWAADDEAHLVAPGASLGKLLLTSKGLPAVLASNAQGDTPIPNIADVPPGMSEVEFANGLDILSNSRKDVTSAPGDVTTEAPVLAVVRHLRQQARAAVAARWLEGRPNLEADLAAAERAAQNGDLAGVNSHVQAVVTALGGNDRRLGDEGLLLTTAEVILAKAARR